MRINDTVERIVLFASRKITSAYPLPGAANACAVSVIYTVSVAVIVAEFTTALPSGFLNLN